jgi:hypothetical protein
MPTNATTAFKDFFDAHQNLRRHLEKENHISPSIYSQLRDAVAEDFIKPLVISKAITDLFSIAYIITKKQPSDRNTAILFCISDLLHDLYNILQQNASAATEHDKNYLELWQKEQWQGKLATIPLQEQKRSEIPTTQEYPALKKMLGNISENMLGITTQKVWVEHLLELDVLGVSNDPEVSKICPSITKLLHEIADIFLPKPEDKDEKGRSKREAWNEDAEKNHPEEYKAYMVTFPQIISHHLQKAPQLQQEMQQQQAQQNLPPRPTRAAPTPELQTPPPTPQTITAPQPAAANLQKQPDDDLQTRKEIMAKLAELANRLSPSSQGGSGLYECVNNNLTLLGNIVTEKNLPVEQQKKYSAIIAIAQNNLTKWPSVYQYYKKSDFKEMPTKDLQRLLDEGNLLLSYVMTLDQQLGETLRTKLAGLSEQQKSQQDTLNALRENLRKAQETQNKVKVAQDTKEHVKAQLKTQTDIIKQIDEDLNTTEARLVQTQKNLSIRQIDNASWGSKFLLFFIEYFTPSFVFKDTKQKVEALKHVQQARKSIEQASALTTLETIEALATIDKKTPYNPANPYDTAQSIMHKLSAKYSTEHEQLSAKWQNSTKDITDEFRKEAQGQTTIPKETLEECDKTILSIQVSISEHEQKLKELNSDVATTSVHEKKLGELLKVLQEGSKELELQHVTISS